MHVHVVGMGHLGGAIDGCVGVLFVWVNMEVTL
jgi:hypothetical protein